MEEKKKNVVSGNLSNSTYSLAMSVQVSQFGVYINIYMQADNIRQPTSIFYSRGFNKNCFL